MASGPWFAFSDQFFVDPRLKDLKPTEILLFEVLLIHSWHSWSEAYGEPGLVLWRPGRIAKEYGWNLESIVRCYGRFEELGLLHRGEEGWQILNPSSWECQGKGPR